MSTNASELFQYIEDGSLPQDLKPYDLPNITYKKHTPLTYAIDCNKLQHAQRIEIIDRLCCACQNLANKPELKNDEPPLVVATNYPDRNTDSTRELIEKLIERGADINAKGPTFDTVLINVVRKNCVEAIDVLLKTPGLNLTDTNKENSNALHYAISRDYPETVEKLLEEAFKRRKAKILLETEGKNNLTPEKTATEIYAPHQALRKSVDKYTDDFFKATIENKTFNKENAENINFTRRFFEKQTILTFVMQSKDLEFEKRKEIIKDICLNNPQLLNFSNQNISTPLIRLIDHESLVWKPNQIEIKEMFKLFVEYKVDVNKQMVGDWALRRAVHTKNELLVLLLLGEENVDFTLTDQYNHNILHTAIHEENEVILRNIVKTTDLRGLLGELASKPGKNGKCPKEETVFQKICNELEIDWERITMEEPSLPSSTEEEEGTMEPRKRVEFVEMVSHYWYNFAMRVMQIFHILMNIRMTQAEPRQRIEHVAVDIHNSSDEDSNAGTVTNDQNVEVLQVPNVYYREAPKKDGITSVDNYGNSVLRRRRINNVIENNEGIIYYPPSSSTCVNEHSYVMTSQKTPVENICRDFGYVDYPLVGSSISISDQRQFDAVINGENVKTIPISNSTKNRKIETPIPSQTSTPAHISATNIGVQGHTFEEQRQPIVLANDLGRALVSCRTLAVIKVITRVVISYIYDWCVKLSDD